MGGSALCTPSHDAKPSEGKLPRAVLNKMVRAGSSGACMQIADFVERVKLIILKDDSSDGTSTKLDELEKQLKWKNVRISDSKALALVDKKGKNGSLKVVLEDTGLFQLSSDESVVELKSSDPDVLGEAPEEDAGEKKLKSAPEASSPDAKGGGSALCTPSHDAKPSEGKLPRAVLNKMVRAGSSGACMQIADFVERVKLIILKDDSSDGTSTKLDELEKQLKWKNVRISDSKALALVDKKGKNGSLKVVLEDTGLFQ